MFKDIFEYKDGKLINKKTQHVYNNTNSEGYIRVRILGKEYRAHRIIWSLFNGEIPKGMLIDHVDGNVLNNKIENLRLVNRQQNNSNSIKSWNKVLPKGVTINPSGKYRARVTHLGITHSLGTFKTIEEAEKAVIDKDIELRGEYSSYLSRK